MSVQAMSWVIEKSAHKGSAFVCLLMIANYAKKDGSGAWPSTETIAEDARMQKRQVLRIIDRLEKSGELRVQRRPGRPNIYDIPGVRGELTSDMLSPVSPVHPQPVDNAPDDEMSPPPVTSGGRTGDLAMSHEPGTVTEPPTSPTGTPPPSLAVAGSAVSGGRRRDEIWDVLEEVYGPVTNDGERGKRNRAIKLLKQSGATVEEIMARSAEMGRRWLGDAECTPLALARNWSDLGRTMRKLTPAEQTAADLSDRLGRRAE